MGGIGIRAKCGLVLFGLALSARGQVLKVVGIERGAPGGVLRVAQRASPVTLNPITALDAPSREVIRRMHADLISINRVTQKTEPALAASWTVSRDGRQITLSLRKGVRFSDGHAFDASDVAFTFETYLDPASRSPQRDLLLMHGKPLRVTVLEPHKVRVDLPEPYAVADRLFDSVAILPRHLLEPAVRAKRVHEVWTMNSRPNEIAGLGPFRLKAHVPGSKVELERNPHYWKSDGAGQMLPYLDTLEFLSAGSEENQTLRFLANETQILNRVGFKAFELFEKQHAQEQLRDLGASLEYNFLFFNLNSRLADSEIGEKQRWFQDARFRRAVSAAIDRTAIVKLAYGGRAEPLWGPVTSGNKLWRNDSVPRPERSVREALELFRSAGFNLPQDGGLRDSAGNRISFSIAVSSSSTERMRMAALIQSDLADVGITVNVVPLEFRSLVDRVLNTLQYDAAILGLGGGDADPNSDLQVWLSSGGSHLWNPGQKKPDTAWEAEIDRLMTDQVTTLEPRKRQSMYFRVQEILEQQMPMVFLASPNVLVAARRQVGNFRPAVLDHYTLWNAEQLFLRR